MDYAGHFQREATAFEAAARQVAGAEAAPAVPSCPGWVVTDLILHLGMVHRLVARLIGGRMQQPPAMAGDPSWLGLAEEWSGWLPPGRAPEGPRCRPGCSTGSGPARPTWRSISARPNRASWCGPGPRTTPSASGSGCRRSRPPCIGGTLRTRWGRPSPSTRPWPPTPIGQTFEFMAPMRRTVAKAPPGQGERFLFRRTDGPDTWAVQFDGAAVRLGEADGAAGHPDLGHRLGPGAVPLAAEGDRPARRAGRHVPARPLLHPGAAPVGKPGPMARADGTSVRCAAGAARQG